MKNKTRSTMKTSRTETNARTPHHKTHRPPGHKTTATAVADRPGQATKHTQDMGPGVETGAQDDTTTPAEAYENSNKEDSRIILQSTLRQLRKPILIGASALAAGAILTELIGRILQHGKKP